MKARPALLVVLSLILVPFFSCWKPSAKTKIKIDGTGKGRIFEGVGAVSAGASSRLLVDYPEPQRRQFWITSSNPTTARRSNT